MKRFSYILLFFAVLSPALARAWNWNEDWRMRRDVYRSLDFTVRAGIDRATEMFAKAVSDDMARRVSEQGRVPLFRSCAAEWRKVQVQTESTDFNEAVLSYALFMQGCACEWARDSNEAVRLYSEVLELYPDIAWVAVPARLRLGCLQLSMGELRKADATFETLLSDPASKGTVARVVALRIVGDRHAKAGKLAEAEACWREIISPECQVAGAGRRNAARDRLLALCLAKGDYNYFEDLIFLGVDEKDKAARLNAVRWACGTVCTIWLSNRGWNDFAARAEALYPSESTRNKKLAASLNGFLAWFEARKPDYEAQNRMTAYALDALRVSTLTGVSEKTKKLFGQVEEIIRSQTKPSDAVRIANDAKGILFTVRQVDLARRLPDLIKDPLAASMMRFQIEYDAGKHAAAAVHLEEYLGHKPDPESARNAKMTLARICRDSLGKYDRAIALFLDVNSPPQTLWELHTTYRRAGKKDEAYRMLVELESMFPNEAPAAFYRHAQCLEEDGNKKQAIAIYRRLLSQPEWKKTRESSLAHQALERHGIATGGAVVNEVR